MQGNVNTIEGDQHPDRDAQFRHLNEQARARRDAGQPVISVDTKKKELVGLFVNRGREWEPTGCPVQVSTNDFEDQQLGKAGALRRLPRQSTSRRVRSGRPARLKPSWLARQSTGVPRSASVARLAAR